MVDTTLQSGTGQVCLRPYQQEAVSAVGEFVARGVRRVLVVAPTGSGKTTIAAHIISDAVARGGRIVFIAHRRELIGQAYRRLLDLGLPEDELGVIMAHDPRRRPGAHVQVASVATLVRRTPPKADLIFIDECHRALSRSYRVIADCYPDAIHLGLTATPFRADGKGLGDMYDELVVASSPNQLIAQGYLVEPRVLSVPDSALPNLKGVKLKRGDYDEKALAGAVDDACLVGNIVEHWLEHAGGVRTVVFAVSVEHSKHIVARFREAGVPAEHLDGATPLVERDAILGRLERAETLVVGSVGVLAEGWDQPAVKCAILARPTKSLGLYLQQAGRILRPWNGQKALILDHAGCAIEHGLPQDDRVFTLEGTPPKKPGGTAPSKKCPQCSAVLPTAARSCPECGYVFDIKSGLLNEKDEDLVEIPTDPASRRRAEWDRLRAIAIKRGYKPGWVYHRYRERFGQPPPADFPRAFDPATAAREAALEKVLRTAARSGTPLSWDVIEAAMR